MRTYYVEEKNPKFIKYNIDGAVIGSCIPVYNQKNDTWNSSYTKQSIEHLKSVISTICSQHDIEKKWMILSTCEGFNSFENSKHITQVLNKYYGVRYNGRVVFDNGSLTFHRQCRKYNGMWILPNSNFSINETKAQFENYKNIPVDYNRTFENDFCVVYSRLAYDRSVIFDHLYKNHYDRSHLIYQLIAPDYYDTLPNFDLNKHTNLRYQQVYDGMDSEYKKKDTAKYILDDLCDIMKRTFVNVISETNYYENGSTWFTEKTMTSIIAGFPFLTSTTVGYYDLLHEYGFKTFSDFWDESFNQITNHEERAVAFLNTLDYIAKEYDTEEKKQNALVKMKPILEHNRNRLFEIFSMDPDTEVADMIGRNQILRMISSSTQDSPY